MSWFIPTISILAVGFAGAFLLSEWIVSPRRRDGDDDNSAMG